MKSVEIYDTTLRDGTQGEGISLSFSEKVLIAKRLDEFGIHYIEGGWPGSNPKDMAFFEAIRKENLKNATVVSFGATRRANVTAAKDVSLQSIIKSKVKAATIFGKSWDFHATKVIGVSLKENLRMIYDSVHYLKSKKLKVFYDAEHFFDGFKENPEYAIKSILEAERAGASALVLCDTNGGSTPTEIEEIMKVVKAETKIEIGIHCHNDMGMAVANSVMAVAGGATQVQGTINGYGERCGNANLVTIMPTLELKYGIKTVGKKKLKQLQGLSRYVAEIANMPLQNSQPFVGDSAFAHKAGVHVNAVKKHPKTYEIIKPEEVGNQRRFLVSELSGQTNILVKAQNIDMKLEKGSPEAKAILNRIQDLEHEGYQFEAAEASLELLMRDATGKKRKKFFEVIEFRVVDEIQKDGSMVSEATLKMKVKDKEKLVAAEGNGPVNALATALKKSLQPFYSALNNIHLTDYSVRVINSRAGTGAKVRVFIQFQDDKYTWRTVGVSENIIEASWKALLDAVDYRLMKGK